VSWIVVTYKLPGLPSACVKSFQLLSKATNRLVNDDDKTVSTQWLGRTPPTVGQYRPGSWTTKSAILHGRFQDGRIRNVTGNTYSILLLRAVFIRTHDEPHNLSRIGASWYSCPRPVFGGMLLTPTDTGMPCSSRLTLLFNFVSTLRRSAITCTAKAPEAIL
jgi:hypothetical protein